MFEKFIILQQSQCSYYQLKLPNNITNILITQTNEHSAREQRGRRRRRVKIPRQPTAPPHDAWAEHAIETYATEIMPNARQVQAVKGLSLKGYIVPGIVSSCIIYQYNGFNKSFILLYDSKAEIGAGKALWHVLCLNQILSPRCSK